MNLYQAFMRLCCRSLTLEIELCAVKNMLNMHVKKICITAFYIFLDVFRKFLDPLTGGFAAKVRCVLYLPNLRHLMVNDQITLLLYELHQIAGKICIPLFVGVFIINNPRYNYFYHTFKSKQKNRSD